MTRFLLIRHAMTDLTGKILLGRTEGVHLNEEGIRQAQNLATWLSELPVAAVYSSPLERARETAGKIAESLNLELKISDDFTEMNYGRWTGLTIAEAKEDPVFGHFNKFRRSTRIPDGETMGEAQVRIVQSMEKLRQEYEGRIVAIISHADLIKSAIMRFAGINLDMFQHIEISTASVSIVEMHDDMGRILLMNGTGDLAFLK